ncbi:hypothetical protein [Paenibacillus sp. HB172176]|uniref:hypothetical protein n=1 Tax=Paenibacillus sp. HB172176 TaxID=2493690 RepID=UPI0014396DFA|nr:hypothetical protein [Paenibacillus sp. HB172176]
MENKNHKNLPFRITWIIPNVFMYTLFIWVAFFIFRNIDGLRDINRLGIYVLFWMLTLGVALFGSYRIWSWIKQGRL